MLCHFLSESSTCTHVKGLIKFQTFNITWYMYFTRILICYHIKHLNPIFSHSEKIYTSDICLATIACNLRMRVKWFTLINYIELSLYLKKKRFNWCKCKHQCIRWLSFTCTASDSILTSSSSSSSVLFFTASTKPLPADQIQHKNS